MTILKQKVEKPISETVTATSGATNLADVFEVPWNRVGYLDLIEAVNTTSNDAVLTVKDSYEDGVTGVSGLETRKQAKVLAGDAISVDVMEDVPLLGTVKLQSDVSGFEVTVAAHSI